MGPLEEAVAHFEEALEATQRMGARPWHARTLVDQARVLQDLGEGEPAAALLAEAIEIARQIGMQQVVDAVSELQQGVASPGATVVPLRSPKTETPNVFRLDGDVWSNRGHHGTAGGGVRAWRPTPASERQRRKDAKGGHEPHPRCRLPDRARAPAARKTPLERRGDRSVLLLLA